MTVDHGSYPIDQQTSTSDARHKLDTEIALLRILSTSGIMQKENLLAYIEKVLEDAHKTHSISEVTSERIIRLITEIIDEHKIFRDELARIKAAEYADKAPGTLVNAQVVRGKVLYFVMPAGTSATVLDSVIHDKLIGKN